MISFQIAPAMKPKTNECDVNRIDVSSYFIVLSKLFFLFSTLFRYNVIKEGNFVQKLLRLPPDWVSGEIQLWAKLNKNYNIPIIIFLITFVLLSPSYTTNLLT